MFHLIFLALSPNYDYKLDEKSFDAKALHMVEKYTQLNFPAGTRGLHMYYNGNKTTDPSFWAKIELLAVSKDNLLKQIKKMKSQKVESDSSPLKNCPEYLPWWKLEKETILIEKCNGNSFVWLCKEEKSWFLYVWWSHY
ncbi:MAG: hypothetical protein AB1403_24600 [Candidatus Riflebacteria bacterium]